ncbi:hypothetical protein ACFW96_38730, partial [Streptomyces gardneri]|uniref:hypothetical protein n=1 Tax=Streptomyces gardneri TaxID=66892 RepID=UPI0036C25613
RVPGPATVALAPLPPPAGPPRHTLFGWPDDYEGSGSATTPPNYGWDDVEVPDTKPDYGGWKTIPGICGVMKVTDWFIPDIKDFHFDGGKSVEPDKGIWQTGTSDSLLMKLFLMAEHACPTWTPGSEPDYFVCEFNPKLGILGRKHAKGNDPAFTVVLVVSKRGYPISMYPK